MKLFVIENEILSLEEEGTDKVTPVLTRVLMDIVTSTPCPA